MRSLPFLLVVGAMHASPVLVGCAGTAEEAVPRVEVVGATHASLHGVVFLTGTEPTVIVALLGDDASSVTLAGLLRDELRRLSGATVQLSGTRLGEGPMARFDVEGYEVLEIDGEKPVVGILHARGDQFSLGEEEAVGAIHASPVHVRLSVVPDRFRQFLGAKMWVIGPRAADGLRVQSYGVIRDP